MKWTIAALICLATCACSTERHRAATSPNLSSAIKRSGDITETINLSQSDSKEIKRAILQLQTSNKLLKTIHGETILILDRNDDKLIKLLESK